MYVGGVSVGSLTRVAIGLCTDDGYPLRSPGKEQFASHALCRVSTGMRRGETDAPDYGVHLSTFLFRKGAVS